MLHPYRFRLSLYRAPLPAVCYRGRFCSTLSFRVSFGQDRGRRGTGREGGVDAQKRSRSVIGQTRRVSVREEKEKRNQEHGEQVEEREGSRRCSINWFSVV